MRRMYSEKELTDIIKEVFDEEVESGVFDEDIEDYVEAYLTEHPVDPTAITGLDIAPKDVNASGNITAPSIIENMSGYSYTPISTDENLEVENIYAGVVKNGNKLTFVIALNITNLSGNTFDKYPSFSIPASIIAKLYPTTIRNVNSLAYQKIEAPAVVTGASKAVDCYIIKSGESVIFNLTSANFEQNVKYYVRVEQTFLLSDNLIPEE